MTLRTEGSESAKGCEEREEAAINADERRWNDALRGDGISLRGSVWAPSEGVVEKVVACLLLERPGYWVLMALVRGVTASAVVRADDAASEAAARSCGAVDAGDGGGDFDEGVEFRGAGDGVVILEGESGRRT